MAVSLYVLVITSIHSGNDGDEMADGRTVFGEILLKFQNT